MGPEDECPPKASDARRTPSRARSPTYAAGSAVSHIHLHGEPAGVPSTESEFDALSDDLDVQSERYLEGSADASDAEDAGPAVGWQVPTSSSRTPEAVDSAPGTADLGGTGTAPEDPDSGAARFSKNAQRSPWERATVEAAATPAAAVATTATATAQRLLMMQAFISRLLKSGTYGLPDGSSKGSLKRDGAEGVIKTSEVSMAFHERGHASELLQYHFMSERRMLVCGGGAWCTSADMCFWRCRLSMAVSLHQTPLIWRLSAEHMRHAR